MGGGQYDDDWVLPSADITLVLVGKLGYGKSATGNSILGREAFLSEYSHASVTNTCQMGSTTLKDGRTINVIDTPGLFDVNITTEDAGKEIVKCMNMAKDGIHAVLMVFSAINRFSHEDASTIETIKGFFGEKIVDHMILVFTYGDMVGESKLKSMQKKAPESFQKVVELCQNRVVLFDNMTDDRRLKAQQLDKLLDVVDSVTAKNGGKPFSDQMFSRIKEVHDREKEVQIMGYSEDQIAELKKEIHRTRDEQLAHITSMMLHTVFVGHRTISLQCLKVKAKSRRVELCQNRVVLFDNMTDDRRLKAQQLDKLLDVVEPRSVTAKNGAVGAFSDQMLRVRLRGAPLRRCMIASKKRLKTTAYYIGLDSARLSNMVEDKLNCTVEKLQKQLMEEQNARLKAEKVAYEARMKSEEEILKLKESLRKAQLENEEFRRMAQSSKCAIL
ncbi:hypothetical protein U9M48_023132 [Paspalum notatum var. saurae]|uniref:AIG1-type G domain-containing protein n=1 Tax=Paspalum notatum var. saurae TaxID=547442 RepID=A0AAQ3WVU5_PASNO